MTAATYPFLQVQGFTKKGKQFYYFDTNLAERISTLHVSDNSIWLTGDFTFTQLIDHAEAQFYIAPDRINDSDVRAAEPYFHWRCIPLDAWPCYMLGCCLCDAFGGICDGSLQDQAC